jgi:hypothetical protein
MTAEASCERASSVQSGLALLTIARLTSPTMPSTFVFRKPSEAGQLNASSSALLASVSHLLCG